MKPMRSPVSVILAASRIMLSKIVVVHLPGFVIINVVYANFL